MNLGIQREAIFAVGNLLMYSDVDTLSKLIDDFPGLIE